MLPPQKTLANHLTIIYERTLVAITIYGDIFINTIYGQINWWKSHLLDSGWHYEMSKSFLQFMWAYGCPKMYTFA